MPRAACTAQCTETIARVIECLQPVRGHVGRILEVLVTNISVGNYSPRSQYAKSSLSVLYSRIIECFCYHGRRTFLRTSASVLEQFCSSISKGFPFPLSRGTKPAHLPPREVLVYGLWRTPFTGRDNLSVHSIFDMGLNIIFL